MNLHCLPQLSPYWAKRSMYNLLGDAALLWQMSPSHTGYRGYPID